MTNNGLDELTREVLLSTLKKLPGARQLRIIESMWVSLEGHIWDLWYNIITTAGDPSPKHFDDAGYAPIRYPVLRTILRRIVVKKDDVFVDIGCGRGRAVCVLAEYAIKECIGVEYQPEHANIAKRNARTLKRRRTPIRILTGDAGALSYPSGTFFLLYNPFGAETMGRFLEALRSSLRDHPRNIRIVYLRPTQEHVFDRQPWLRRIQSFSVYNQRFGHRVRVVEWHSTSNRDSGNK
jgi:predicted RNA methylase